MKPAKYILIIIVIVALSFVIWGSNKKKHEIIIKGNSIFVTIAKTELAKSKGLMGVKSMPENEGMLFVFDQIGKHSFWMKNTLIPLDIIWLDENEKVVYIEHSAPPCPESPCPSYLPETNNTKYVIELNGGWAANNSLSIGDAVYLGL